MDRIRARLGCIRLVLEEARERGPGAHQAVSTLQKQAFVGLINHGELDPERRSDISTKVLELRWSGDDAWTWPDEG